MNIRRWLYVTQALAMFAGAGLWLFGATSRSCSECKKVSLKRDLLPVLNESCLPCHYDKKQAPGLDLSDPVAYANLVNQKSRLDPHLILVKPSSPSESFLVDKLSPKPKFGEHMPPYGRPLTTQERTLLIEWIVQGAPNN